MNEENKKIDNIISAGLSVLGEKKSISRQYMEWLDTEPKVFHNFKEWLFSYHPEEYKKKYGV